MEYAAAQLKTAQDTLNKLRQSYRLDPKSVSKDQLDTAENTVKTNRANLGVARRQYELTKAGAWIYDIQNQQHQFDALTKTYESGAALLAKYTIRAPVDGVVLAVNSAAGNFTSAQGTYNTYTQGYDPVVVMGPPQEYLEVRCYIDEILIPRMPAPDQMQAQMQIRGTNTRIPLGVRAGAALREPQDRAFQPKDRAGGRPGAAGPVPLQAAKGHEGLSGATGGRLCGNEIIRFIVGRWRRAAGC